MPRGPRIDAPGLVHHVMVRGIERRPIFHDDADRQDWLDRLARILPESGVSCFAWVLMSNHVHLVVQRGPERLSRVMARLNTGYAKQFNTRYQRVGHLFQNRYAARRVRDEADLMGVIRYVHLNPLRGGLVATLDELARFPWCGHGALMGQLTAPPFQSIDGALAPFGSDPDEARAALQVWMESAPEPTEALAGFKRPAPTLPGNSTGPQDCGESLAASVQAEPSRSATLDEDTIGAEIARICAEFGIDREELRSGSRTRAASEARAVAAYVLCGRLGLSAVRAAPLLGASAVAVSRAHARGRVAVKELPRPLGEV